jgi:hypothetical protein
MAQQTGKVTDDVLGTIRAEQPVQERPGLPYCLCVNGGADETRTRDLRRDRRKSFFSNSLQPHDIYGSGEAAVASYIVVPRRLLKYDESPTRILHP